MKAMKLIMIFVLASFIAACAAKTTTTTVDRPKETSAPAQSTVYFEFDKTDISHSARQTITGHSSYLSSNPGKQAHRLFVDWEPLSTWLCR